MSASGLPGRKEDSGVPLQSASDKGWEVGCKNRKGRL
jgi:hypothetical protein